jgi:hypothetical protein
MAAPGAEDFLPSPRFHATATRNTPHALNFNFALPFKYRQRHHNDAFNDGLLCTSYTEADIIIINN